MDAKIIKYKFWSHPVVMKGKNFSRFKWTNYAIPMTCTQIIIFVEFNSGFKLMGMTKYFFMFKIHDCGILASIFFGLDGLSFTVKIV